MIWLLRIYLFLYFILYFGIGAWAVIEPVREILEFDILLLCWLLVLAYQHQ